MTKKSTKTTRGTQKGPPKHKVGARQNSESNNSTLINIVTKVIPLRKLVDMANLFYRGTFLVVDKLCLITVRELEDGNYTTVNSGMKRKLHISLLILSVAIMVHHVWATVIAFTTETTAMTRIACISLLAILPASWAISSSIIWKARETADLLNSCGSSLKLLKETTGKEIQLITGPSTALKLILATSSAVVVGTCCALASIAVKINAPIGWFETAQHMGLISTGSAWTFGWKLLFLPAELLTNVVPIILFSYSSSILIIGLGLHKKFADEIRALPANSLMSRRKLESLYVAMEVFSKIFCAWAKFMIAPSIFMVCTGGTIELYVLLRFTNLPLYIYVAVVFAVVGFVVSLFAISYEGVCVIRSADETLTKLRSLEAKYMMEMPLGMKREVVKRSKAMRSISFPIGEFGEFSLTLPVNLMEEVLNQLLFLLSF